MSTEFSDLWSQIPRDNELWDYKLAKKGNKPELSWREVYELLSGALWHLELGASLGPFPSQRLDSTYGPQGILWRTYLNERRSMHSELEPAQLTMTCPVNAPSAEFARSLVQSMLVANGALRIAGARWLLFQRADEIDTTRPLVLHREPLSTSDETQRATLIVLAFRDSFMHGEMPDGGDERKQFREA